MSKPDDYGSIMEEVKKHPEALSEAALKDVARKMRTEELSPAGEATADKPLTIAPSYYPTTQSGRDLGNLKPTSGKQEQWTVETVRDLWRKIHATNLEDDAFWNGFFGIVKDAHNASITADEREKVTPVSKQAWESVTRVSEHNALLVDQLREQLAAEQEAYHLELKGMVESNFEATRQLAAEREKLDEAIRLLEYKDKQLAAAQAIIVNLIKFGNLDELLNANEEGIEGFTEWAAFKFTLEDANKSGHECLDAAVSAAVKPYNDGWIDQAARDSMEIVRLEGEIDKLAAAQQPLVDALKYYADMGDNLNVAKAALAKVKEGK